MKYYLDSNIFIYSVTKENVGPKARQALEAVEKGRIGAVTSALTVDEVVWIVQNETDRDTAIETGQRLLEMDNLDIVETGAEVAAKSLKLMEDLSTYPRDSMHIASARQHGIYTIATEDSDLQKLEDLETVDTTTLVERISE